MPVGPTGAVVEALEVAAGLTGAVAEVVETGAEVEMVAEVEMGAGVAARLRGRADAEVSNCLRLREGGSNPLRSPASRRRVRCA